jgi:hypothetical protein
VQELQAIKGMPRLVKELLEIREKSATIVEGIGSTTFNVASLHHHEVLQLIVSQPPPPAEVIYNFCSEDEIQSKFGYNEDNSFTMTGRLMSVWRTSRKVRALIDAIGWLHDKGGAHFRCHIDRFYLVWTEILFRKASPSIKQAGCDALMLATLINMFPDKLDGLDGDGLYLIHRATINGHCYALKLLLDYDVNINSGTRVLSGGQLITPKQLAQWSMTQTRSVICMRCPLVITNCISPLQRKQGFA